MDHTAAVDSARMVDLQQYEVVLDYHQFYLETAAYEPDLIMSEEVRHPLDRTGIVQVGPLLVVGSPHQNNVGMQLTVEVWDAEPANDLDQWQEGFHAHLDARDYGMYYASPDAKRVRIDVPPGSYHALITGRGFTAVGWPGSTTPGDRWRIRLWPSNLPAAPARLSAFTDPRR